jgi:hypothetical protein
VLVLALVLVPCQLPVPVPVPVPVRVPVPYQLPVSRLPVPCQFPVLVLVRAPVPRLPVREWFRRCSNAGPRRPVEVVPKLKAVAIEPITVLCRGSDAEF